MIQRIVPIAGDLRHSWPMEQLPALTSQVVVKPEETDEILANPGMGWETFHQTSKQDKSLPSGFPPRSSMPAGVGENWSRSQGSSIRRFSTRC